MLIYGFMLPMLLLKIWVVQKSNLKKVEKMLLMKKLAHQMAVYQMPPRTESILEKFFTEWVSMIKKLQL